MNKPDGMKEKHLEYMDGVRDEGEINPLEAAPMLAYEFDIDRKDASRIVLYWMKTYSARHSASE